MTTDVYEFRKLNINPSDDLFSDRYSFMKKLGQGLTSKVYKLRNNQKNYSDNKARINIQECVIKISRGKLTLVTKY